MELFHRLLGRKRQSFRDPPSFQPVVEKAMNRLRALTAAHDETWHLGEASWSVDQEVGTIVFKSRGIEATAPVQIIGSFNAEDSTWLWGWDHPSVWPALAEHAKRMYEYGREHGIPSLTTRKFACSEHRCWELTAAACMICEAQGAYRGPEGDTFVFMTFGDVRLSPTTETADLPTEPGAVFDAKAHVEPSPPTPDSAARRPLSTLGADVPAEVVKAFIRDHHRWEVEAFRQSEANDHNEESWRAATVSYDRLIRKHCAADVVPQGISFGNRPGHDPDAEIVQHQSIDNGDAIVTTTLVRPDGSPLEHEYHLVWENDRWVIRHLFFLDEGERLECL